MSNHTLVDLLKLAVNNELLARDIYQKLSCYFSHLSDISLFFQHMENDETVHAEILKGIIQSLSAEESSSPAGLEEWSKVEKMHQSLVNGLNSHISSLDDAFELTHELEASELNYFMVDVIDRFILQEVKRSALITKIVAHQEKTIHLASMTGDKKNRELIKAKVS